MNYKRLKIFAIMCMLVDHVIRIFPVSHMILPLCIQMENMGWGAGAAFLMDWTPRLAAYIGRLAAPIFMFCIVNGFLHTGNLKRYMLRVAVTACVAQVPYIFFELAESRTYGITGSWTDSGFNILFTLALGLMALWAFRVLRERDMTALGILAVTLAALLARVAHFEGKEGYILIIFMFYLTRDMSWWKKALIFVPVILLSRWGLVWSTLGEPGLLPSCILNVLGNYLGVLVTLCYTGKKGGAGRWFQWIMYAFYPVHLATLALIGFLLPRG